MNFQEKLKQIRELVGLDENVKSLLEKMTGKELVSYEGIDALVAALMTFYNGKIKTITDEKWKIVTKYIGNTSTSTDFNSITENGAYYSSKYNALYTNGFLGANQRAYQEFKLIVIGENNDGAPVLKSQLVITRDDNIYLRSCTAWQAPWTWSEWKKIARISDVDEKFKNFCPFPVNSLYISLGNENPSSLWLGTTWQKQENRFLLGAGSSFNLGSNGGNSTVTLSIDNLPSHNHTASTANHSHTQQEHTHTLTSTGSDYYTYYGANYIYTTRNVASYKNGMINAINSAGGDTTGSASPTTSIGYTGSDSAFSIMPPYLAVNIWKRTS